MAVVVPDRERIDPVVPRAVDATYQAFFRPKAMVTAGSTQTLYGVADPMTINRACVIALEYLSAFSAPSQTVPLFAIRTMVERGSLTTEKCAL